jgi:hypothetical protein
MQVETRTFGLPNSLDATTVGVRTDSGYRFGSFNGGAFIELLATISVNWADINGFSLGGNRVSFNDDPNVERALRPPSWHLDAGTRHHHGAVRDRKSLG